MGESLWQYIMRLIRRKQKIDWDKNMDVEKALGEGLLKTYDWTIQDKDLEVERGDDGLEIVLGEGAFGKVPVHWFVKKLDMSIESGSYSAFVRWSCQVSPMHRACQSIVPKT